jgi:diguanylate cyclase (GGDEF)-like protein
MLIIIANLLVFGGAAILVHSTFTIRRLVEQLPSGQMRQRWRVLNLLTVLFIAGYLGYALAFWNWTPGLADLLVPLIFFFGATFVWLTTRLSLQTTLDIRRVALLEQENITDPLIGIYNRRYLERRLEQEIQIARRHSLPLAVLMLDIDHFKRVNDTFGHPVGDQVLSYLGKLVLGAVRESDIVCRYGGEELLVIAVQTTPAAAAALAERLRQHIEAHALVLSSAEGIRQELHITISIGAASLEPGISEYPELVQRADQALYQAKQSGRNRVVSFSAASARAAPQAR